MIYLAMAKNSEVEATEDWDGTYKDELEWSLTKMTLFNKNIGRHLEMERELSMQIRSGEWWLVVVLSPQGLKSL